MIDPKPLSGDPGYEVAPLLWNRWDEVAGTGSIRHAVLDRFHAVVDVAGLEEDRARDWVVVREMLNVLWAYEDQRRPGDRGLVGVGDPGHHHRQGDPALSDRMPE